MKKFLIKEIYNSNIGTELKNIGFDSSYISKAKEKFEYKNFKLFNLTVAQANIIKQCALSVGADCATNKNVITGQIEKSSCILGGSISQLKKICQKLQFQPFGLKDLSCELTFLLDDNKCSRTKIMGILNITPDSFSDGGKYFSPQDSIERFVTLVEEGADIIDIGAESTKPYSNGVDDEEQIKRLTPIFKYISSNKINTPISIDTRSSIVAQFCIDNGASIINDVSGLDYDKDMVNIAAKNNVKVIIQHSKSTPDIMQNNPHYENLMDEIFIDLKSKLEFSLEKGIKKENIILDPGIGFGKTREHNFEIIKRWRELKTLNCPILIGLSRKSLLNIAQADNYEKDIYTLALNSILMNEGIDFIRVHNVKLHKTLQKITNPI